MTDEIPQPTQDQPAAPPPAWDEVKKAPEYSQLDPNQQLALFSHWRTAAVQHMSSQPGYTPDMLPEFNQAATPEMQRLGDAATYHATGQHSALYDHLQDVPTDQQPEGFWGTLGRTVATRAFPTVATVGGALGAGALGIESGPGALVAAGAGGAGAGIGAEALQKQLMGEDWFNKNQKQIEVNAQAHPVAHQIGTMLTFLASAAGGGEAAEGTKIMSKIISPDILKQAAAEGSRLMPYLSGAGERAISGGAQFARAGAVSATEDKGEIAPGTIAEGAARNAVAGGALGLFPAAKTLLGTVLKGATTDAAAMTLAGGLYDYAVDGQPLDWKKIADETKGNATSFAIMNGVMGLLHGTPLRIKSGEPAPPETPSITPDEEKIALDTRIKQLQEKQQTGQLTGGQTEQLDDLKKLQELKGGPEAPPPAEAAPVIKGLEQFSPKTEQFTDTQGAEHITQNITDPDTGAKLRFYGFNHPTTGDLESIKLTRADTPELAQRQGGATKLIEALKQKADELGVPIRSGFPNERSKPLLEKLGFRPAFDPYSVPIAERNTEEFRQKSATETPGEYIYDPKTAPKEVVAPERIAKAEEGRPTAPLEQVSKAKQDSAQKLWAKALDEGREPTIQEWQKAAGKGGPALRDAFSEALKQVYPQHETFSNNTKDIAERLNRGEEVKVPKELEEHLNPNINLKRLPDGTAQVASVDHPDYGNIKNPGDLDRARAPEIAKRRAVQKTAETLPELTPEGKAATEELLSIATEDDIKKTEQFMRSHNYTPDLEPSGQLYDALYSRALKTIHRGKPVNNIHLQQMLQTFRHRGLEGLKTELPTPESGRELGTQPEQFTGEVKPEEVGAAAGTVAPEAPAEAATSPHEQALKDSGITDPKAFLDQVNERMRAKGKPELTMEDIAAMQQKAGEQGTEAATPSIHDLDPAQKLQNTQKLAELGFYTNKENPIGEVINNLAESGTPLEKLVANLLKNSGVDFSKVKTVIDDYLNARGRHEGRPNEQDFRISLNPSLPHGDKGIVGTLLHEAYHHVTVWKLQSQYVPNKYEAAAIKQLQGIMEAGRVAAFKEIFGREPTKKETGGGPITLRYGGGTVDTYAGEFEKFLNFLRKPNSEKSRKWLLSQPLDRFHKLINNHEIYYGVSSLQEMAAEITNPAFHNFVSNLPPTPSVGGAFKNLLQQFNNFITRLVAGRPVPQMDRLRNYLEAAATLGVDAPRTRGIAGTELIPTLSSSEMVDKAFHEAGVKEDERSKSPGMYASLMKDAGLTPYIGNFLGSHDQMFRDATDELAKNPNAAVERLEFLRTRTDPSGKRSAATAEDYALFLAHLVPLRQQLRDALRTGDAAAIKAAEAKVNNWSTKVFQEAGISGKALQALQGSVDINTGDYFTLKQYYKMTTGKDFTPEMEKDSQKIVQDTTEARIAALKSQIQISREIPKLAQGAAEEATKGTKLISAEKKAGAAAGVSVGKDPATGKDQGWLDFQWGLDPKAAGQKLSQYLNARGFGAEESKYKAGQKNLTIREVGNIWQYIKANYLQGVTYVRPDELVNKVAKALVVDPRVVKEAITAPKTLREFVDDRYRAQAQQRSIVNATKAWMDANSRGTVLKWANRLWEAPRSLAVIGHVNPSLTHAGSLLFRPTSWKEEIPSIAQAFRASFLDSLVGKLTGNKELDSQVYHEKLMQDTMGSKDYGKLTNLGLAAKVGTLDDIGQYNTYLGRVGVAGNRGMDVLKALRMQLAQKEYDSLKGDQDFQALDEKAKDDQLREMVSRINSETGTTTAGFTKLGDFLSGRGRGDWRTFLFAPKLEGSRWQQMVIDPLRATGLMLKGNSATAAEKYFRKKVFMRQAELMITYGAALGANAAILKAIGSDDKINLTDPTRSDWLAFKVNGQTVLAPSSFLAPLRLSLSVALSHVIPAENRQPYTDKIINYAMGKVTPTISDLVEIARAKQQYTGRPIEALQNLYENMGVKFSTPRNPKDPIALYEWAATKGPIPLAATVEGWHNAMVEQGASPALASTIIGASIALTSSIFAVHQHPTTPLKETNP